MADEFPERLTNTIIDELASGPRTLTQLVHSLRQRRALGPLEPYDDDQVAEELTMILMMTDSVWTTDDGFIASMYSMLDGTSFSHAFTTEESKRNALGVIPDFVALGFDMDDELPLSSGGHLRNDMSDELGSDRDDFVGPPGWLKDATPGQVLALSWHDGVATLVVNPSLSSGEKEQHALLASFEFLHEDGIMTDITQVILDALCRDRTLFRSPVVPIAELFQRAGIECDGEWLTRQGEAAEPPGVIYRRNLIAELAERYDFDRCCTSEFEFVLEAWSQSVLREPRPADIPAVARALAHGTVFAAFVEYVLGDDEEGSSFLESFASSIAGLSGKLGAPGHLLLAANAERDGRTLQAERLVKLAVSTDGSFAPALRELAWYETDRGHFSTAISLLRRAGFEDGDPAIDDLQELLALSSPTAERNDPCPCGSGRKFKACCLVHPNLSVQAIRQVLHHKIMRFAFQPQREQRTREIFVTAMSYADEERVEGFTPLLLELATYNTEALTAFEIARGPLLPDAEQSLVRAWLGSRRSLWQVLEVTPGASMRLRDACTGEEVDVLEKTASTTLLIGDYVYLRLMQEGSAWVIESEVLLVPVQHRGLLLEVLDEGGDPLDIAAWMGQMFGPVTMVNYEGEDVVMCRTVLVPTRTPWTKLSATLDRLFSRAGDDQWHETVHTEQSPAVRCFLTREDDTLILLTNSVERLERVLALLEKNVADLQIVEDERTDVATARAKRISEGRAVEAPYESTSAEVLEAMRTFVLEKEAEWLDSSIPALSGLTPRQAAKDPTRREDLVALLNEFDHRDEKKPGLCTFDVARLREALDLPS
jgi:hypothetical protein